MNKVLLCVATVVGLFGFNAVAADLSVETLTGNIWCVDDESGSTSTFIYKANGEVLAKMISKSPVDPSCISDCQPVSVNVTGKGFWRLDNNVLSTSVAIKYSAPASVDSTGAETAAINQTETYILQEKVSYYASSNTIVAEAVEASSVPGAASFSTYKSCK